MTLARRALAVLATTVLAGAASLVPPPAAVAADPVHVSGVACQKDQGVTVVVDYTPKADTVVVACAIGASFDTSRAAFTAAGFALAPEAGKQVTSVDGVDAIWPDAFWSVVTSSTTGVPGGTPGTEWTFGQVGVDAAAPVKANEAIGLSVAPQTVAKDPAVAVTLAQALGRTGTGTVNPPAVVPTKDGDALAAAGWIGRRLAANGGVINQDGKTDWGLTMDAVFALAGAGVGGTQLQQTAAKVFNSGEAYIGAPADARANAARIGKTVLALQVAGLDATKFPGGSAGGTRNLISELRGTLNPDGSFGTGGYPFSHSLVVFALARTDGGVPASAVRWLQGQQCATDGENKGSYGWGGCQGDADATSLSIQALRAAGVAASDPSVADAATWLARQQLADGSFPMAYGNPNTNTAGIAAQTFRALGEADVVAKAAGYVGSVQISCQEIKGSEVLKGTDQGAIAYDAAGFTDAKEYGLDDAAMPTFERGTAQAIFALAGATFDKLTAAGAAADLPGQDACSASPSPTPSPTPSSSPTATQSPTTSPTDTQAPTTAPTQTSSAPTDPATSSPTSTSTALPGTGAGDGSTWALGIGVVALVAGGVLVLLYVRLRRGHRGA